MPKAATKTSTKAATKAANAKSKAPKDEKAKRAPSAYNVFMKDRLAGYKAEHPEMNHKEAFTAVAALWKDAPENPNRGQESRTKKKSTEDKENAASKPKSKAKASKKKVVEQSEDEDDEQDDEE